MHAVVSLIGGGLLFASLYAVILLDSRDDADHNDPGARYLSARSPGAAA
jgi:hypothetical protein